MQIKPPCLILNQDYTPLSLIGWKRAICLEIIGSEIPGEGILVIEYYKKHTVKSAGGIEYMLPAVAVSPRYIKRVKIPLRKKNIIIRDNSTCQYCGHRLGVNSVTIDHVKPKSKFKNKSQAHTWDNVVVCCSKCNTKKGDKTPKEAGMKLLKEPQEPNTSSFFFISDTSNIPEEWSMYVSC